MRRILVATDFSTRSDRALRRARLLAMAFDAALSLVHVVDDDQPAAKLRAEREAAGELLKELSWTLRTVDGVSCDMTVALGEPFAGIVATTESSKPDLLVIGSHRRQVLREVFVGTTAERTIRQVPCPVLMANAVPAGAYHHLLLALDLSETSREVVRAAYRLALDRRASVSAAYVIDAPEIGKPPRARGPRADVDGHARRTEQDAAASLAGFLADLPGNPVRRIVRINRTSVAETLRGVAKEVSADLVVIGTRGRSGLSKLLLGSTAQELLGFAEFDVLTVPSFPDVR
ncbi:MAG: universal stress protein [Alphaproteobacteria bacterium]|nr:universal stress protein [Alphaproteobacteria bacterium]